MTQSAAPSLASLETLYETHHRQAIGLAYRMLGDMGDAEEVVQEVFLSAWRSGHSYDPSRGSTHTWILSMVRNRSIDVLRARRRRPVQPLVEGLDPPDPSDVPLQAAVSVDADLARQALAALPPEQKQVIELAYFDGLSHSEIADKLAAPIGTVKGRIRLGLDRLRVAMGIAQDALSTP
ncbi:MAG TPA: sigma-70 family RNA polymerase sigma factor [Chloroflexota bacterium]|jgi:RNA polymerase sigma-70 factor (ECF subfamily)|nr:sigma-70 family RNA polymerase sigma factor [Chloroflexota bacterium]